MKHLVHLLCIGFLIILSGACKKTEYSGAAGLAEYANDESNSLVKKGDADFCSYRIRFENADIKWALSKDYNNTTENPYSGKTYFTFELLNVTPAIKEQEYGAKGNMYSYNDYCRYFMDSSFCLDIKGNLHYPVDYTFIPGDYLLPYDTFLFVFEDMPKPTGFKFIFHSPFTSANTISIKYRKKDIKRIPKLKSGNNEN